MPASSSSSSSATHHRGARTEERSRGWRQDGVDHQQRSALSAIERRRRRRWRSSGGDCPWTPSEREYGRSRPDRRLSETRGRRESHDGRHDGTRRGEGARLLPPNPLLDGGSYDDRRATDDGGSTTNDDDGQRRPTDRPRPTHSDLPKRASHDGTAQSSTSARQPLTKPPSAHEPPSSPMWRPPLEDRKTVRRRDGTVPRATVDVRSRPTAAGGAAPPRVARARQGEGRARFVDASPLLARSSRSSRRRICERGGGMRRWCRARGLLLLVAATR